MEGPFKPLPKKLTVWAESVLHDHVLENFHSTQVPVRCHAPFSSQNSHSARSSGLTDGCSCLHKKFNSFIPEECIKLTHTKEERDQPVNAKASPCGPSATPAEMTSRWHHCTPGSHPRGHANRQQSQWPSPSYTDSWCFASHPSQIIFWKASQTQKFLLTNRTCQYSNVTTSLEMLTSFY